MTHTEYITQVKQSQGDKLLCMGHHYQSDAIIQHMDFTGDSLELARKVAEQQAEYIVFCGVSFMAETAEILSTPEQKVLLPAPEAGCIMSDMAPAARVDTVLRHLTRQGRKLIPLAYVNTSVDIKAVISDYGGAVCTSANAATMLRWALEQGDGVLFLPDKNLGNNTADLLGIAPEKRHLLSVQKNGETLNMPAANAADLLLWPGLCVIHERFSVSQIETARTKNPDVLVIVHPECPPDVVQAADAAGSTSRIITYCREAPEGSTIIIGTEINLVSRLTKQYKGKKDIRPLLPSACKNMAKTTEELLALTLDNIDNSEPVYVPQDTAAKARITLERMLQAC